MATEEDLGHYGSRAKDHWPRLRPRAWRALKKSGRVNEFLAELNDQAERLYNTLRKQGLCEIEAMSMAEREFVALPDYPPAGEKSEEEKEYDEAMKQMEDYYKAGGK